jgi:hypothetical protein
MMMMMLLFAFPATVSVMVSVVAFPATVVFAFCLNREINAVQK